MAASTVVLLTPPHGCDGRLQKSQPIAELEHRETPCCAYLSFYFSLCTFLFIYFFYLYFYLIVMIVMTVAPTVIVIITIVSYL